ncbi:hypothetical protein DTL42_02785 [Bremerella cremea]|uniref:Uncharacterized protein n=1 Tax=Bremerella cremea TaxID=1031537 RepID=A0A368KWT0_9BACT|nr:hypothetical protein [Bremerella cremea]RCS54095.1 hypothetical protein DTL42_02785 [Bremerella cremea]
MAYFGHYFSRSNRAYNAGKLCEGMPLFSRSSVRNALCRSPAKLLDTVQVSHPATVAPSVMK